MYKYPYGDSQQLNLDWILAKLKELEDAGIGLDLENVSKALISLPYNTSTAYRRYDYAFRNGKLYRCLSDTTGAFDPAAWQEALIGDDLAVLTRWINAIDAAAVVDVKFDTSGTNGKLQQKYHDQYHDVVEVDYAPVQNSKRPLSSNAGYELTTTKRISTLSDLDTSENHFVQFNANINVGGITFPEFSKGVLVTNGGTDATIYAIDVLTGSLFTADKLSGTWRHGRNITTEISNLNGAVNDEHDRVTYAFEVSAYYETSNIAQLRTYSAGDYVIVNDRLWKLTDAVPQGSSFIGHITRVILGNEVQAALTQTIPVDRGGTGQTTVDDAKNAYGIPNLRISSKPIPRQETTILNIGRNARGMLFIPPQGFYIVSSTSGGAADYTTVAAVPNVTITAGSYQLTVVNNSTANFIAYYLDFENVAIS